MKPLQEVIKNSRAIEAEAAMRQLEVQAELEKAQRDIVEGKDSTGSKLHDGLVVLYGSDLLLPDSKITANYEKVAEELKGKTGEPVVMIHRWVEHEGCSGFGGERTPAIKRVVAVGVISEEELVFDYEKIVCVLSTSAQTSSNAEQLQIPNPPEGGLVVAGHRWGFRAPDLGADLNQGLNEGGLNLSEISHPNMEGKAMTLAIGHDGIKEWLAENNGYMTLNELSSVRQLCEQLEIEPIEPATEWQKASLF